MSDNLRVMVEIGSDLQRGRNLIAAKVSHELAVLLAEAARDKARAVDVVDRMRKGDAALRRRELRCRMKRKVRK